MKFIKTNEQGFGHHLIIPALVLVVVAVIGAKILSSHSHADTTTSTTSTTSAAIIGNDSIPGVNTDSSVLTASELAANAADSTASLSLVDGPDTAAVALPDPPAAAADPTVDASSLPWPWYPAKFCNHSAYGNTHECINSDNLNTGTPARAGNDNTARIFTLTWDHNYTTIAGLRMPEVYMRFTNYHNLCLASPTGDVVRIEYCNPDQTGIIWALHTDGNHHLFIVNRRESKRVGHWVDLSDQPFFNYRYHVRTEGQPGWFQRQTLCESFNCPPW